LARGLDYYTSTIYELKEQSYGAGSLAGGGRYDRLIGMFSGRELPAVGVAFGFDRLLDALTELNLLEIHKTATQALVTIFSSDVVNESTQIAHALRARNISTELFLDIHAKLEKQLKYADKKGIPFVVVLGDNELKSERFMLKNLSSGHEQELSLARLISVIKDVR
jgi:histidyl-tRNA synthetase